MNIAADGIDEDHLRKINHDKNNNTYNNIYENYTIL